MYTYEHTYEYEYTPSYKVLLYSVLRQSPEGQASLRIVLPPWWPRSRHPLAALVLCTYEHEHEYVGRLVVRRSLGLLETIC